MTPPLRSVFGVCQAFHFVNRIEVLYPHQFIMTGCKDNGSAKRRERRQGRVVKRPEKQGVVNEMGNLQHKSCRGGVQYKNW